MTAMQYLIGDRVLIKPDEEADVTASGLVLPDSRSREYPQTGTVVALPRRPLLDLPDPTSFLKPGDRVVFDRYKTTDVELDDSSYKVLLLEDIYGIIEPA